jgi:hypothetical protein
MPNRAATVGTPQHARPAETVLTRNFAVRHPDLAYVFGPTVRAFFVVGCLALDLLAPLQILALMPGHELAVAPLLSAAFLGLAYVEYRLYRRIWPPPMKRNSSGMATPKRP